MSYEDAIAYMEKYQCLPLCKHGNHLIDWGRELLAPPCGCSLTPLAPDAAKAEPYFDPGLPEEYIEGMIYHQNRRAGKA